MSSQKAKQRARLFLRDWQSVVDWYLDEYPGLTRQQAARLAKSSLIESGHFYASELRSALEEASKPLL